MVSQNSNMVKLMLSEMEVGGMQRILLKCEFNWWK